MPLDLGAGAALCGLVFLAGFVDAIAGGGGLISLPAYVAAGLPPHAALATNKFSGSCGTGVALLRYWRAGSVRARAGLLAALGALPGSALGARVALLLPAAAVNVTMLVLVPAVLGVFLLQHRLPRSRVSAAPRPRPGAAAAGIGFVVGAYDGFFGPGTGTFLTIAFTALLGLDLLAAAASARLANFASNAGSLAVFLAHGRVVFPLALATAAAGVAGNLLGATVALRRGARVIRPLVAAVLVLLVAEIVRRILAGGGR